MQAVPELVEERQHVIVRQESRPAIARRQHVANEVGRRQRGAGRQTLAPDALVHPRAAALVGSGVGIEVEAPDWPSRRALDLEEAHVRMPDRSAALLAYPHLEEPLGDLE